MCYRSSPCVKILSLSKENIYDKEHNYGQIVVSREIYAKSADMMWGEFLGGDKGEGSIQNVENYGIEVPAKTAGLYLVPRQRNLIFWDFGDFRGFLGGFEGIFWVSKVWRVFRTRGTNGFEVLVKTQGLYQLPKLRNLILGDILYSSLNFTDKKKFVTKIHCAQTEW